TVERLMRELGIAGASAARKRPRTTVAGTDRPGDLLERDFTANAPNRRWVADITMSTPPPGGCTPRSSRTCSPGPLQGGRSPTIWVPSWRWTRWRWRSGPAAASVTDWSTIPTAARNTLVFGTPNAW